MSSCVIYTSIFGDYDDVIEQKLLNNYDWKCFSEDNSLSLYSDNNRNAKKFKILPHRYLSEYECSIFIDGNMTIVGDTNELIEKYLSDANVAFFSHNGNDLDSRNCVYDEANTIFELGEKNIERNSNFLLTLLYCIIVFCLIASCCIFPLERIFYNKEHPDKDIVVPIKNITINILFIVVNFCPNE